MSHYVGGQQTRRIRLHRRPDGSPRGQALPLQFDFGPAGMPVASGYDEADKDTGYSSSLCYQATVTDGLLTLELIGVQDTIMACPPMDWPTSRD